MFNPGIVIKGKDELVVEDLGEVEPASDEAVVEIAYGGICGSDLSYWLKGAAGASILREPMILGHEVVGTVTKAAADGSGPAEGTLVAVHPLTPKDDGKTPWPKEHPNLAPASTYLGSAMYLPHEHGGFARFLALPTRMLYPLPEGLTLEGAALAEPAAVAWRAVTRVDSVEDKKVAVIGGGPIGQLVASVALTLGASEVTITDLADMPLEVAGKRGIKGLLATDADAIADLHADVVFESSGTVPGLNAAVSATKRGGQLVLVGLQALGDVPAPMAAIITRELTVRGSFRFAYELGPALEALADGSLDVTGIVTHTYKVDDTIEAFDVARDPSQSLKVVVDFLP